MHDDNRNDNAAQAQVSFDDDEELEGEDGTLTGDTLMDLVSIPFFVGGESFISDVVDDSASSKDDQPKSEPQTVQAVSEGQPSEESVPDDEEGDDDTVTSFSHYDSIFPDE